MSSDEEIPEMYLVWVAGKRGPRRLHGDLEGAKDEAKRLYELVRNRGKAVYIFQAIDAVAGRKILTLKRNPWKCEVEPLAPKES